MTNEKEKIIETEFFITKATLDEKTGKMVWAATASDTDPDSYSEKMSLELYQSFINGIDSANPPYLSLAHYPKLKGKGVAGEATEVYIQGKQLKAKGYFNDTPLGIRSYNAIREDRREQRSDHNKIRISIGFYDRMHSHSNGIVWDYASNQPCTQCALGIGGKVYLKGVLEHLALTRVPVNKRTDITAKSESEDMTTRYEDALSIVGDTEIVDEIEKAHQDEMKGKSDANGLIERSDNPGLISVIGQLNDQQVLQLFKKMSDDGSEITEDAVSKLVNDILNDVTSRSETVNKDMNEDYKPFGGATSFAEGKEYMQAAQLENNAYRAYSMFGAFASNILTQDESTITDKLSAMQTLLSEFKSYLDPKKLMELSEAEDKPVENTTNTSAPVEPEIKADTTEVTPVAEVASTTDIKPLQDRVAELEAKLLSLTTQHPASVEVEKPVIETANPVVQSVVDEFTTNLSAALTKKGEERNIALQEVMNKAGETLLAVNRSLSEQENAGNPASNDNSAPANFDAAVSRAIDEKLAPVQQMQAQLGNQLNDILKALQGQQISRSTNNQPAPKLTEVPQTKSIVLPNGMLPQKPAEGLSILDIATRTTFGSGR